MLVQMCVQGSWSSQSSLLTLPHLQEDHVAKLNAALKRFPGAEACGVEEVYCIAELLAVCECTDVSFVRFALDKILSGQQLSQVSGPVCMCMCVCVCVYVHVNVFVCV